MSDDGGRYGTDHTWTADLLPCSPLGVLIASLVHRNLFAGLSTWIWFGAFIIISLMLGLLIVLVPRKQNGLDTFAVERLRSYLKGGV